MVQENISVPVSKTRKRYSGKVKFQVVLEMIKGGKTMGEVARAFGVHPTMLEKWSQFRTTDWANYLEYPELTYKETQRLLSF